MVRAQTTTGRKAEFLRICPPRGVLHEPLCNIRESPEPSFDFDAGPLIFAEFWEEQPLAPSGVFDEFWEFSPFAPGTLQWNEPWELMVFGLGPNNFTETWDAPAFNLSNVWVEPWTPSQFNPGPALFFEQWEAGHAWFKSEYWAFGGGGGGGG